jgi:hypothetical protein
MLVVRRALDSQLRLCCGNCGAIPEPGPWFLSRLHKSLAQPWPLKNPRAPQRHSSKVPSTAATTTEQASLRDTGPR